MNNIELVKQERERQEKLWGNKFDDKNTANDWVAFVIHYLGYGSYSGRKELYNPEKFKKNLIKAATICIAAADAIDRNGNCAPRHYENLPKSGAKDCGELK